MSDHADFAFAVLGVLMRREGRDAVHVTYDELSAEPIQLIIHEGSDGSLLVMQPRADQALTPEEIARFQREACATGKPITRAVLRERMVD